MRVLRCIRGRQEVCPNRGISAVHCPDKLAHWRFLWPLLGDMFAFLGWLVSDFHFFRVELFPLFRRVVHLGLEISGGSAVRADEDGVGRRGY